MYPYNPFLLKISFPFKSPLGSGDSSCGFVNSGFETRARWTSVPGIPSLCHALSASLGPGAEDHTSRCANTTWGRGEVSDLQGITMSVPRVRGGHSNSALVACIKARVLPAEEEGGAGWRLLAIRSTSISTPFPFLASMNQK